MYFFTFYLCVYVCVCTCYTYTTAYSCQETMVNTLELEVATFVTYQTWVPPTSHPLLKYSLLLNYLTMLNVEYSCVATKNLELYIELSQFARAVMTNHRFNGLNTICLFSFAWEDRRWKSRFLQLGFSCRQFSSCFVFRWTFSLLLYLLCGIFYYLSMYHER